MREAGEGIILEDDCSPALSFFGFVGELLNRYRESDEVVAISGYNGREEPLGLEASYLFSDYFSCWGWATWKRAWDRFDGDLGAS